MSHVDEGTLAGYIDGQLPEADRGSVDQHLATCEECRSLLAEERRRSDYARAILRTTGTRGSKTPSFSEVIDRSRTRSTRRSDRRRLSRLTSLAWAATIVVAVAIGWFARNLTLPSPELNVPDYTASAREEEIPVKPEPVSPAAPAASAFSPRVRGSRAPSQRRNDVAGRSRVAAPRAKVATPPQAPAAAPPSAELAQGVGKLDDRDEKKAEPAPRTNVAETAPEPAPAAAPGARRKNAAVPLWIDSNESEATRVLGRHPLAIPDLPVASYSIAANGDGSVVVRQLLSPGNEIVLTERLAPPQLEMARSLGSGSAGGARNSRAPAPVAARSQDAFEAKEADDGVVIQRQGYSVTARGPVSRDSLAALLGKVR